MFLRDFRKTRKRRHFVDDLKPLDIDGWIAQPIRLQHLHHLTNKEASTVLCSVIKHAGSGRARKPCREKHKTQLSVFPHFFRALPLHKCFTTEQSTVEASLFVYDKESNNVPRHSLNFQTKFYFPREKKWRQPCTFL